MSAAFTASLSSDRRSHRRMPTARKAVVITPDAETPCTIADRSSGGLRLVLLQERALPPEFEIEEALTGEARRVRLVWLAGRQVGVAFMEPDSAD